MYFAQWLKLGRKPSRQAKFVRTRRSARPCLERLEDRIVLSVTVGPNINITKMTGNNAESTISINPTNTLNLFEDDTFSTVGHYSLDGGTTWQTSSMSGLPASIGDVQTAWDTFGNLYLASLTKSHIYVDVALSTNGGASFTNLTATPFSHRNADQPSIAVGPGNSPGTQSVWVSWTDTNGGSSAIEAAGAQATGLGAVGAFTTYAVPNSVDGDFGDVAVGPSGQVMVTYQYGLSTTTGPDTIVTNTDSTGVGGTFGAAVTATPTQVGGHYPLPAQPSRTTDAEANLAWDRSGGPHNGRVYLVYTDANPANANDTNILVRYSDNHGASWSSPVQVNDDATTRSQFMPAIALDQTTGNVAVTWYDARNSASNTTVQVFGSVSTDGGATFATNVQISAGTTNATVPAVGSFNLGDYDKMDFSHGVFYRTWADNSNSTGDNPDGTLNALDIYTAKVTVAVAQSLDTITGTAGDDQITLIQDPDHTHIDWTMGASNGQLPISDPKGLTINGNGGSDRITLNYGSGNANPLPNILHLNGTFTINGLQGSNPLANTNLEMGRSTIYISYVSSPFSLIQGYLRNGYNNGAWNGTPTASTGVITSIPAAQNAAQTTAIGYADSSDGLIAGQPVNTIELEYTLYGDTMLTGSVGFNDFTRLTQHYNQTTGGTWDTGDFNYDGSVNSADFTLMTRTYNTTLGSQAILAGSAVSAGASAAQTSTARPSPTSPTLMPTVQAKPPAPTHVSQTAARKQSRKHR